MAAHSAASGEDVPRLPLSFRLSSPFCGIDGAGRACLEAGWLAEPVNLVDKRRCVMPALRRLHGHGVAECRTLTAACVPRLADSRRFSEAVGGVPSAPPPHAPVALEDMLMDNSTITDLSALTCGLRRNICFYNKWLNSSHDGEGLACANIDRSPGNKFCPRIMVHKCPTLTTANTCLFVMKTRTYQTSKVAGTGRWVTMEERANLSGVVWSSILDTGSDGELLKSLGNMFPVDMAGRTLWPIMMCMSVWQSKLLAQGLNTLNWEGVNYLKENDSCLEGVAAPSKRRRLRPSLRAL